MPALLNKNYMDEGKAINLRVAVASMSAFESTYVLESYARELHEDSIEARISGWFELANYLSELAHQLQSGNVVMPGEFIGLEHQVYEEYRREEETLNTGLKPKVLS